MTERLQKCIDAGGIVELFPLLSDWTKDELRALCADIDALYAEQEAAIDKAYTEQVFKIENFFNAQRAETVHQAADDARMNNLAMCSEIYSVALLLLGR